MVGSGVIALYRVCDIALFAVNWVFVHAGWLLSTKRSLAMFLINLVEVIVCYPIIAISFGCLRCSQFSDLMAVLYSSLRTTVTIRPASSTAGQK